jgi:hypothetical protein
VAVVTGGTSGLGRAIALAFAYEGAAVTIGDVRERPADGAPPTAEAIRNAGGRAAYLATDVTRRADVDALVARAVTEFGALDVMVNNAGVQSVLTPAIDKTEAEWARVIAVDLTGVWFGCQAALRQLIRQGQGGRIINISSRLALQGVAPGRADYCGERRGFEPDAPAGGRSRAVRDHRQRHLPGVHPDRRHARVGGGRQARGGAPENPLPPSRNARGRGGLRGLPGLGGVGVHYGPQSRR